MRRASTPTRSRQRAITRLRRAAEAEPERLLLALEHAVLVVEAVEVVGDADRVGGDTLRAALRRRLGDDAPGSSASRFTSSRSSARERPGE